LKSAAVHHCLVVTDLVSISDGEGRIRFSTPEERKKTDMVV